MSKEFEPKKLYIKDTTQRFVDIYKEDPNSRYKSFDHCRKCFLENRSKIEKRDLITLNLYAYLASWGMLRNSFLMQKDYKFLSDVVDKLCDPKYDSLLYFDPFKEDQIVNKQIELILSLKGEIEKYYNKNKYFKNTKGGGYIEQELDSEFDTNISKILLGTFACVPAYDKYVKLALREDKIEGVLNESSLKKLVIIVRENEDETRELCEELNGYYPPNESYTPMKILDMYYWEKGLQLDEENKKRRSSVLPTP